MYIPNGYLQITTSLIFSNCCLLLRTCKTINKIYTLHLRPSQAHVRMSTMYIILHLTFGNCKVKIFDIKYFFAINVSDTRCHICYHQISSLFCLWKRILFEIGYENLKRRDLSSWCYSTWRYLGFYLHSLMNK